MINKTESVFCKRVKMVRKIMQRENIDLYYIPTDDFHASEYVGDYFKCREFISGFTGSAGTLVITKKDAFLWTDGRYFLQAQEQLRDSGISLCKMGEPGVPSINEYIFKNAFKGMVIGFDGRCINTASVLSLVSILDVFNVTIRYNIDIVDAIWEDRPGLPTSNAFVLENKYAGEDSISKISRLRNKMNQYRTDTFILTSLDDIAWLLNIRADDVMCNPVLLSYLLINKTDITLYCFSESVEPIKEYLNGISVEVKQYNNIYADLRLINKDNYVLADFDKVNYSIYHVLSETLKSSEQIIDKTNPTTIFKAVKNNVEINNERAAHIKDAVAYVKFLYWFSKINDKRSLNEITVAEKLLAFRKEQKNFIEESFEPIVAYGSHGAIVHYSATPQSNKSLDNKSFVLIDTGGHYLEGTTDITRTLSCGELTDDEKNHYTMVLKGNLRLGNAKFIYGTRGINLDILAREPLWENNLDYNHGTGHGVGYLLNVHEGPNNIRYRMSYGKNESCIYEPGMITSNEPGVYITGQYGIRLENMIVCKMIGENGFGKFLGFDTLTLVPFDLKAINISMLDEKEKEILNNYHREVYCKISPYLELEESEFLKTITSEI